MQSMELVMWGFDMQICGISMALGVFQECACYKQTNCLLWWINRRTIAMMMVPFFFLESVDNWLLVNHCIF